MKRLPIVTTLCCLLAAAGMQTKTAQAQNVQTQHAQVMKNDTTGITTATVAATDTLPDGLDRTNSVTVSLDGQEPDEAQNTQGLRILGIGIDSDDMDEVVIVLIVFVSCVTLPVLIVFFSLRYKYKMRRTECMVAARALEAGKSLPDNFLKEPTQSDLRTKGIRNISIGVGLALFLGFLCGASLSTIGIFIALLGAGQVVTYYTRPKQQDAPQTPLPADKAQAPAQPQSAAEAQPQSPAEALSQTQAEAPQDGQATHRAAQPDTSFK
ncbi:MAG: DUF6249 domain-containing protein [Prevotellaceae bacterium]|nr:DUF6249 domain-containing protein [Prevotellaceae bacterium]